jgi:hypothetical protein
MRTLIDELGETADGSGLQSQRRRTKPLWPVWDYSGAAITIFCRRKCLCGNYTSVATFAKMLRTNSVWATQVSCLNDHTEFRYAVRLLRDKFKEMRGDADEQAAWFANYAYDALEFDGADNSYFFVFCMSLLRDDLSQWRAYAGGEGGVCIGFDAAKMLHAKIQLPPYLLPVRYEPGDHKTIVDDVAHWTVRFFKEGLALGPGADYTQWADSFSESWRQQVIGIAPALKDQAFRGEAEWRLVCSLHPDDISKVEILQRSSLISRHLPLPFERLPIREVIIGPCRHPFVSHVSVDTFLRGRGYEINGEGEIDPNKVTITRSAIPFQTV